MKEKNAKSQKLETAETKKEKVVLVPEKSKKLLVLKNCVLSLAMPGRSSGVVTKSFREGQIVYDSSSIEQLIANDAPVEFL